MTDWPFNGLCRASYGALLVDPPWPFRIYSGTDNTPSRTAVDPYPVMSIADLMQLPVADLAKPDCVLFLWVVDAQLHRAIEVGNAWGFLYKTRAFEWVKLKQSLVAKYGELAAADPVMGMGYWTRKQTESCLLFTRGKPARLSKSVRQVIAAPRREHSRKPDEQYERIEALVAGPYCELFATHRRIGWAGWGRDYPEPDLGTALRELTNTINNRLPFATIIQPPASSIVTERVEYRSSQRERQWHATGQPFPWKDPYWVDE